MIFVDTSAIYALASDGDPRHGEARRSFHALLQSERPLITHSYVLSESMALLQHRLGRDVALAFAVEARGFEVQWWTRACTAPRSTRFATRPAPAA